MKKKTAGISNKKNALTEQWSKIVCILCVTTLSQVQIKNIFSKNPKDKIANFVHMKSEFFLPKFIETFISTPPADSVTQSAIPLSQRTGVSYGKVKLFYFLIRKTSIFSFGLE